MAYVQLTSEEMDKAAEEAEKELQGMPQTQVIPLARWFHAHYMKAGHKRLGRLLVQVSKATKGLKEHNWTNEEDVKE